MRKLLTSILFCITILVLSYTNEKVYAATEQSVAGVGNVLDRLYPIEVKSIFNNVKTMNINYNWTTTRVNLRKEPFTDSDIIITIDKREKVEVLSILDDWAKVKYENQIGYVVVEYLSEEELFTSDKNRWGIELSEDEIDLAAKIVWIECRGEIQKGRYAVIEIILNRMIAKQFPDTLYNVLSEEYAKGKYQFSSWTIVNKAKPTEETYNDIYDVIDGKTNVLTTDYLYFSTSPRNNNGTIKIGNHYFCREDN